MPINGLSGVRRRASIGFVLGALVALFAGFGSVTFAAEGRKLALVIGNDAYAQQPALAKAVGDAHAMQAALEKLGFAVKLAENLDYPGMVEALANFQSSIDPGDIVAFHFSGHGVAANGRNYLLPVDFPQPESGRRGEVLLPRLAFDAGEIVEGLRSQGAALTLAVLDACRDNALSSGTRSIGMSRGLVRMDPPRGVFVMFSAGPGELAADRLSDQDPAATSVFTRVFIPILETPGLTLVEIAKRTQVEVSELAATVDHQQFPDYSDRVIGDVILIPRVDGPPPVTESKPSPSLPEVANVTGEAPGSATAPTAPSDIAFGDDASQWANNGLCDDSRFSGPGMTDTTLIEADIGHDATDCRTAFETGKLTLRATASRPEASSSIDYGDDTSEWANNGLCDDSRFSGPGMTDTTLIEADIRHDATDCRTAFEGGRLSLR